MSTREDFIKNFLLLVHHVHVDLSHPEHSRLQPLEGDVPAVDAAAAAAGDLLDDGHALRGATEGVGGGLGAEKEVNVATLNAA